MTSHRLLVQVCAFEPSFISGLYSLTRSEARIPAKAREFSSTKTSVYTKDTGEAGGEAPLVLKLDTTAGDYRQSDMVKTG